MEMVVLLGKRGRSLKEELAGENVTKDEGEIRRDSKIKKINKTKTTFEKNYLCGCRVMEEGGTSGGDG
jgi:hypothetical protein